MEEQKKAVQRMQDYIAAHLYEEITLGALASVSFYSPWYSYRIFIQYINMTPSDYIRRYRLSQSALKLRDEKVKIIDVAFQVGFKSVDGYQRAFYKEFGCHPHEYAANPIPIYLFCPNRIETLSEREKDTMTNEQDILIQVIQKPARKVLIKRGEKATDYFSYCNEVGCDVWGLLTSIKSISGEPVCLWLPKQYQAPGTSEYVQGVEVPVYYEGVIPDGFDVIELPACKYMLFQGKPFDEDNYVNAITQVQNVIQSYDPSVLGYTWDKDNPRIQLEPIGNRGYIELVAVKI